jgi:hypothetical protein
MANLLLIGFMFFAVALASVQAQTLPDVQPPNARLIKPHSDQPELRPIEPIHRPLDERCRSLNDELELQLQKSGIQRRLFQARLAHNAGTRLCREGRAEKGIAELQRGLSYFQDVPR